MTAAATWEETGYTRRRALSDALYALRCVPPPFIDEVGPPLDRIGARRAVAAIAGFDGPLAAPLASGDRLDILLAVYLAWVTDDPTLPNAEAGATLAFRTRFQTANSLHAELVDAVCGEIGRPAQDL